MEIIKLGDVCKIVSGKKPNNKLNTYLSTEKIGLPFPKQSDIDGYILRKTNLFYNKENYNLTKIDDGLGIYFLPDAEAKPFISKIEFCMSPSIWRLHMDNKKLLNKYMFYWMIKNKTLIDTLKHGTTIQHIKKEDFKNLIISLPQIEYQQQIIDIIEPFEKIRENISIKIQRIFDIADKFYEIKEKQKIKISLLASLDIGKTPSRKNKNYWENGEIHWINSGAITNNNVVLTSHEKITKQAMIENNLNKTNDNDILISIIEPSKNKISISCSGITYNQSVCRFRPNEYNFCFFISLKNNLDFISSLKHGSAQQSVNKSQLLEHDIFYVKDTFFENIFKYVKHLEKIKFLLDKIIKNLIEIHIK